MSEPQSNQNPKAKKLTENKSSNSAKQAVSPKPDNAMDRFNAAMRKILSVPKKNVKDK